MWHPKPNSTKYCIYYLLCIVEMIKDVDISPHPQPGPRVICLLGEGRVLDDANEIHLSVVVHLHIDPRARIEGQIVLRTEKELFRMISANHIKITTSPV